MFSTQVQQISRREFLKLSALGMLGALMPAPGLKQDGEHPRFGRVMDEVILSYKEPSYNSEHGQAYAKDSLIPVHGVVVGDTFPPYNQAWFEIDEGYIHTSQLQPVDILFNPTKETLNSWGELTEVTVPFTDAFKEPKQSSQIVYRYYYSSTHWIDEVHYDSLGQAWYRVMDDLYEGTYSFVLAKHLRVITKEELEPISGHVPIEEKHIEVRMADQLVIATESGLPVFIAQASTGDYFTNKNWQTPLGGYLTFYKRPSRHMAAGNLAVGDYDLPGVPWACYLTKYGIAIHGTYWHNDFGHPRSHGCVNLAPEAAKWIYRWTLPTVPVNYQLKYRSGYGTRVDIIG